MRVQRNTDAALNGQAHVIQRERPQHLIQNAPRDALSHRGISSMQVDHELISTQPTEHVGLAQSRFAVAPPPAEEPGHQRDAPTNR